MKSEGKEVAWLLEEKYGGKKCDAFFTDILRLKSGEPLAYVIGHIPFVHATIHLDSRPLIPRAETEFWTMQAIDEIKEIAAFSLRGLTPKSCRVLDLCAGSGCIGIAALMEAQESRVDFGEIDVRHHDTIKKNLAENNISPSRARILGGDLFEQITETYDFILANPPYIDPENDQSDKNVRSYEPHVALYGGSYGIDLIRRIIAESPKYLHENGVLYMEHDPEQTAEIERISKGIWESCKTFKDQYGKERFTRLARKA